MEWFIRLSLLMFSLAPLSLIAAESLSYSGRLVNTNGSPVTGPVHLKFDLAYTNNLSTILCTHDNPGVDLINGVFHAKLEFNCPSSSLKKVLEEVPSNNSIAIRVTDLTPATPKVYSFQALHSIPFTIMSNFAKQLVQMGATNGQVLTWNGTEWAAAEPAGTMGGVTTIVAEEGLGSVKVDETVTIGIINGGVTAPKLHHMGATSGQVLKWNGTSWAPSADLDTGVETEADPTVRAFARNDVTGIVPPSCSADQTLQYALLTDSFECTDIILNNTDIQTAAVADALNDGEVAKAPSQNAVFDALSGKQNTIDSSSDITMKSIKLMTDGTTWVGLKSPTAAGNLFFTLPGSWGTNGQVLRTDGAGNLSWTTPSTSSADIVDGSIVDADIAAGANIAQGKISGLGTSLTNLDNRITNLKTDDVPEGATNFYFAEAKVLATDLAGVNTTAGAVTAADSILSSIGKIVGNVSAVSLAQDNYVLKNGTSVMSGALNLGTNKIINLADPAADQDAATKKYVDDQTALAASQWTKTGSDIYYNSGNVGIGTITPTSKLEVNGVITNGGFDFLLGNADQVSRGNSGLSRALVKNYPSSQPTLYLNYSGDFTGGTIIGPIFSSANVSGNVGIGTNIPANKLDIVGSVGITGLLRLKSDNANFVELKAPLALGSTQTYTFPASTGTSGYALTTNGAGVLSWSAVATTDSNVGGDLSGTISNAQIVSGSIVDSDINASAGIAQSKIFNLESDLASKQPLITAGTNGQYWRGDKSWQTLDTSAVPENGNLYFLDSRVRIALMSGYSTGTALPLAATDTLIEALGKLEAQIIANDAAFDATGQWSKNGTSVYYNGGNVGIGTTDPTLGDTNLTMENWGVLTVAAIPTVAGGAAALTLASKKVTPAVGDRVGVVHFVNTNNGSQLYSSLINVSLTGSGGANGFGGEMSFFTKEDNSTLSPQRMVITNSGNVGIGTSSPQAKLDVSGTVKATAFNGPGILLQFINLSAADFITNTSNVWTDVPNLSSTFTTAVPTVVDIVASGMYRTLNSSVGNIRLVVNGTEVAGDYIQQAPAAGTFHSNTSINWAQSLAAGTHTIKVQWRNENATGSFDQGWNDSGRVLSRRMKIMVYSQ